MMWISTYAVCVLLVYCVFCPLNYGFLIWPPVEDYPEICTTTSLTPQHDVFEPSEQSAPYSLVVDEVGDAGLLVTISSANSPEHAFRGFIVSVHEKGKGNTPIGIFYLESAFSQVLTCETGQVWVHEDDGFRLQPQAVWEPPPGFSGTAVFSATVVQSFAVFWVGLTVEHTYNTGFDLCEPNPCLNEGLCTGDVETYTCACADGYTGDDCENNINDCDPNQCQNEGQCIDGVDSYTCTCADGYDGDNCENNINDCDPNPCQNEGQCTDEVVSYTCTCADGYDGDDCENNINDCDPNPCLNERQCIDGVDSYTCTCADGYDGDNCENNINDCDPNPCQNEGQCTDGVNSFTCVCAAGYDGDNCENNINDCDPNPCQNEGQCTDGVNSFTCVCAAGYDGDNCENNINDCDPNPCQNEGQCEDGVDSYICTCADGSDGDNCENNINDCDPNPCQNEGQCTDEVDSYTCTCADGYDGDNCENNINDCDPNPCQNEGQCIDGVDSYTCTCADGYDGDNCEFAIIESLSCPDDIISTQPSVSWQSPVVSGFLDSDDVFVSYTTAPQGEQLDVLDNDFLVSADFEAGTTLVTATASDIKENSATCNFLVTFRDEEPPVLSCSPSEKIIVETSPLGSNTALVTWNTPEVQDNSGETPRAWTQGFSSGNQYAIGSYEVLYTAIDSSGNAGYCVVEFEVIDREPPLLVCPEDISRNTEPSLPTSRIVYPTVDVLDNSGERIVASITPAELSSGAAFPIGITQVFLTATDSSDNSATCSFTVTVIDNEPPRLTCESLTANTDPGKATTNIYWVEPEVNDNSGEPITAFSQGPVSGTRFSVGPSTLITYSAVDSAGNRGFCVISIKVIDTESPRPQCPDDQARNAIDGDSYATVTWDDNIIVLDNADFSLTATSDIESGTIFELGPTVVTYSAVDGAGNVGTCSFNVFVSDAESPVVVCPENVTVEVDPGINMSPVTWVRATATDNSGQRLVPVPDIAPGSLFPLGTTRVTYSATDTAGNIGQCSFLVSVSASDFPEDTTPPSLTCPEDQYVFVDQTESGTEVTYPAPIASDNGGSLTLSYSHDTGSFFNTGETLVLVSAIDESGNSNRCVFNVNVIETSPSTTESLTTEPTSTAPPTTPPPVDCEDGFQEISGSCFDINECLQPRQCPIASRCENTEGSYTCRCREGYQLVSPFPNIICIDLNECEGGSDCHVESMCINSLGGYQCVCPSLDEPLLDPGSSCPSTNPCDSSPCNYEGICNIDDTQAVGYQCDCTQDRRGPNCDLPIVTDDTIMVIADPELVVTQRYRPVTLECRFDNAEEIAWYFDETQLTANRDQEVFYIPAITAFDQGYYYCIGANSRGETIETEMASVRAEDVSIYPTTAIFGPLTYTEDLQNPQTDYFLQISSEITAFVEQGLQNFAFTTLEDPPMIQIKKFMSGSVVARLNVYTSRAINDVTTLNDVQNAFDTIATNSAGFLLRDGLLVQSAATCRNITCNTEYGAVFFPNTPVGQSASSNSSCLCNTGPVASLTCNGDLLSAATWTCEDVSLLCQQGSVEEQLQELSEKCDITVETSLEVVERVHELSNNTDSIFDGGVTSIADVVQKVADVQPSDPRVTSNVVSILSNLMDVEESMLSTAQADAGSTNQLIMSLEALQQNVSLTDGVFAVVSENIGLEIRQVQEAEVENGLTFTSKSKISIEYATEEGLRVFDESTASSIVLPPSLTRQIFEEGASSQRIAFTVFQDASLFISSSLIGQNQIATTLERTVNTQVISCSIGNRRYTNLEDPVVINYAMKETGDHIDNTSCVFWDFMGNNRKGDWSSEGCSLVGEEGPRYRECQCNHLTNFAVLVNIYGPDIVTPTQDFVLELLSYIGCGLSILSIIVIFIAYLPNRKLRSKLPNKILLSMCAALLLLYIFSIVIILLDSETEVDEVAIIPCSILAGILHFSLLSVLAWTVVEGVNMYLLFVRVFNTYVERFMIKAYLFAYGLPAVIVGVTAGVTRERYAQTDLCFLQSTPLMYGVLLPMGIIVVFNTFIYVRVLLSLTKPTPGKTVTTQTRRKQLKRQLKNAAMFLLLLGLTWSVGYLALIEAVTFLAQLFFCLLNSMLGYFLFMVYVIRQPVVRKQLIPACCKTSFFKHLTSERLLSTSRGMTSQIPSTENNRGAWVNRPAGRRIGHMTASFNQSTVPLTAVERNRIDNIGEDDE